MHISSVTKEKKSEYYWKATELWLNGTKWSLNGHWNVPAIQSTEWRLSVSRNGGFLSFDGKPERYIRTYFIKNDLSFSHGQTGEIYISSSFVLEILIWRKDQVAVLFTWIVLNFYQLMYFTSWRNLICFVDPFIHLCWSGSCSNMKGGW